MRNNGIALSLSQVSRYHSHCYPCSGSLHWEERNTLTYKYSIRPQAKGWSGFPEQLGAHRVTLIWAWRADHSPLMECWCIVKLTGVSGGWLCPWQPQFHSHSRAREGSWEIEHNHTTTTTHTHAHNAPTHTPLPDTHKSVHLCPQPIHTNATTSIPHYHPNKHILIFVIHFFLPFQTQPYWYHSLFVWSSMTSNTRQSVNTSQCPQ